MLFLSWWMMWRCQKLFLQQGHRKCLYHSQNEQTGWLAFLQVAECHHMHGVSQGASQVGKVQVHLSLFRQRVCFLSVHRKCVSFFSLTWAYFFSPCAWATTWHTVFSTHTLIFWCHMIFWYPKLMHTTLHLNHFVNNALYLYNG